MNIFPSVTLAALVAIGAFGTAIAAADGADATDAPVPASTLARAEVLVDLEVWRESGMAALDHGDGGPDVFSPRYLEAASRYAELRQSPAFAQRVERLARQRGEVVTVASH